MIDLEQSITKWRQHMIAAGIKTPVPMEELESHLRDDVERSLRSGMDVEEAFAAAVRRIGLAAELKAEFAKTHQAMSPQERKLTWILCGICVAFDLLLGLALLGNCIPGSLDFSGRVAGAAAWFLFPAVLWSWRYSHRWLPVFSGKYKRLGIAVLSSLAGGLATTLLLHLAPPGGHELALFCGPLAWALLPLVIGVTLIFGLEEAAYQNLAVPGETGGRHV